MEPLDSAQMREVQLELLDELHRICTEHGLRYFLAYGTLIGAIRHKGFIPWDDDTDVILLRSDYERLVAHFDEWRSDDRFVIIAPELGNSPYPFGKIYDARTVVEQTYTKSEYTTGIWIDLFPLDPFDPNKKNSTRRKVSILGWIRYFAAANPDSPSSNALQAASKRLAGGLFSLVDPKRMATMIDDVARTQCSAESDQVACMYYLDKSDRWVYPKAWFESEPLLAPFEDRLYWVPQDFDAVLTHDYGAWRTPVPQEPHGAAAFWI